MTKIKHPAKVVNRKVKVRGRSGCRTCKIRKVKCDEKFPVCNRCISTGRVCDGYGIWGGGGNDYWQRGFSSKPRSRLDSSKTTTSICPISALVTSTDEMASFDWFRRRAITKLPGGYSSDFWTIFLLQVSHGEKAVWHAVLALSSTHRVGFPVGCSRRGNKPDQATLSHLSKAIGYLQPHFSARDKTSFRVVLVVCLVFVVLDLLRGHFASAQAHLRSGLSILAEAQPFVHDQPHGLGHAEPFGESIDDEILHAFLRLSTQVGLLQYPHRFGPSICLLTQRRIPGVGEEYLLPSLFTSYTSVWRSLDLLLNEVFRLTTRARECERPTDIEGLITHQQRIKQGLDCWLTTYNDSLATLSLSRPDHLPPAGKAKIHRVVLSYNLMLTIMNETAIHPNNERIFDSHTHNFESIIGLLSETYRITAADADELLPLPFPSDEQSPFVSRYQKPRNIGTCDMTRTIIDTGWMIPLFYVATRCRHRILRRQAIQLLWSTDHREGFWDAKITACIAERVADVEERSFYGSFNDGNIDYFQTVDEGADESPALPGSYRIRNLEVQMQGNPLQKVLLFGELGGMGSGRVCIGEYDVSKQQWV
ncbi:hypothetical protein BDV18DRAFT_143059 [Aspergillus unguis]